MKVLVACEFSGVVSKAFKEKGHEVHSCDLLHMHYPNHNWWHYQGPVEDIINDGYDLMIAHPPCTYLCNSGVRWLHASKDTLDNFGEPSKKEQIRVHDRWKNLEEAIRFFCLLKDAPINKICLENPIPHKYATISIDTPTQYVQPWQFGHKETKKTGLWLKNLPPLVPTNIVEGPYHAKVHLASPGPDRWRLRSITYEGIANSMASQWG